jgi:hypothetical protein
MPSAARETDAAPPADPAGGQDNRPRWQELADRLERLRSQGEPWTSYDEMRKRFEPMPSTQTLHKAVHSTPNLTAWAGRPPTPRRQAPERSRQELKGQAFEDIPQEHEPDPADAAGEADLRKVFENAEPDERAFLNSIGDAPRDYQSWYISEPAEARKKHRDLWLKHVQPDATLRAWFFSLRLCEKLAFLNDPDRARKIWPR